MKNLKNWKWKNFIWKNVWKISVLIRFQRFYGGVYFAISRKSSAGTILIFELHPPLSTFRLTLSSYYKKQVKVVEWFVSVLKFQDSISWWVSGSDVLESFMSSQSHKPFESESSKFFSSRVSVRVMTWSSRIRVESQELSSRFESLVCKLESMSSHRKFLFYIDIFLLWNGTQHAIKWRLIS